MKKASATPDLPTDEPDVTLGQSEVPVRAIGEANHANAAKLKSLLANEFVALEQAVRQFQGQVAAISTDAAYQVKRSADYFAEDIWGGVGEVITALTTNPNYVPDDFAAAVIQGRAADVALIEVNPLPVPPALNGERRLQQVQAKIEVADVPVAPRSKKTKKEVNQ